MNPLPSKKAAPAAFTLAEIIIGISVLSVVLVAMTMLTISAIRANQANINRLTAYYLAQEAVEGVRNMRDSNWLQNYTWDQGAEFWGNDLGEEGYYTISYVASASELDPAPWVLTSLGTSEPVFRDDRTLLNFATGSAYSGYTHDEPSGMEVEASRYWRYIHVVPDSDEERLEITAYVQWNEYGRDSDVAVTVVLTDWRGGPI